MSEVKQKPTIRLVGKDGNAFAIMGAVSKALKSNGYSKEEVNEYMKEAMAGDYNHLLQVTMKWVEVE